MAAYHFLQQRLNPENLLTRCLVVTLYDVRRQRGEERVIPAGFRKLTWSGRSGIEHFQRSFDWDPSLKASIFQRAPPTATIIDAEFLEDPNRSGVFQRDFAD